MHDDVAVLKQSDERKKKREREREEHTGIDKGSL